MTTNWEQVRARLQSSENALQDALSASPDRVQTVFRERAGQLAKRSTQLRPVSSGVPALLFRLGVEQYAINLSELAEVRPFEGCTPVPGSSPNFLGVINLRGELRPVVDLGLVLSGSHSTDTGFVLILHRQVGLKVDEIADLREIRPEEFPVASHGKYIRGLAPGPVMLLDVEAVCKGVLRT
jgi:chemotaxis signal transduction protein